MIDYTPPGPGKFAIIPKELIDAPMSPAAKVVLMHMLKNVADWEESVQRIAERTHMGKFQVTSALKELQKEGYARQTTRKLGGNLTTKGWDFAWPYFKDETHSSNRDSGFQSLGDRCTDGRATGDRDPGGRDSGARGTGDRSVLEEQVQEEYVDETTSQQKHVNNNPSPADPTEETRVLRNFNGYKPPAEPAKLKRAVRTRPTTKPTDDPDFDRAWDLYANKVDKVPAQRAWTQARKHASAEEIIAAIPAYVAVTLGKNESEGRSWKPRRKNFATWLNAFGWTEEIEQPKQGYQGRAGADARPRREYEDQTKHWPIPKLMRYGPFALNREGCYAWYWHWNRDQADWSLDQLVEFGNTPEDAQVLFEAFTCGPREGWAALLATLNIETDRP